MFRENDQHLNKSMFCTIDSMDPRYAKEIVEGWAGLFYKNVFCAIDEKQFEPLYSKDRGRPNTPVNILASLEIIKHLWNYTDEQLFRTIRADYEVNYALGLRELGSFYIGDRTVYDFRERLLAFTLSNPEKGSLIFQLFKDLTSNFIEILGIDTGELRMDSTMIESNIKKAGRLALAFDVLNQAVKVIPDFKLTEVLKEVSKPNFKTSMLYRVGSEKLNPNLDYLLNLGAKALEIAKEIPEIYARKEIKILERLLDEQAVTDKNTKKKKAKPDAEISPNSLQSAYDPDATYRKKGDKKSSGYVLNLTETCSKDNPIQMIVDYLVAQNTTSDKELLKQSLANIDENTMMYLDGGYSSVELWQEANAKNIDLMFTDMTGTKPDPNKLPLVSFNVDINNKVVLNCPAGHKPLYCSFSKGSYSTRFDLHICQACPLAPQCPAKQKKQYSKLNFSEKSYLASLIRMKCLNPEELAKNLSTRAAIEGTISGLKIGQRLAELFVRGQLKVEYYTGLKIVAANVKRFFRGIRISEKNKPQSQGGSVPILAS